MRAYFYALTAHFGHWQQAPGARATQCQVDDQLLYGQLVKRRERRQVVFTTMRMLWGKRADLTARQATHGLSHCIQSSFIERVNLTLRQSVAPLTRKTWPLPQSQTYLLFTYSTLISRFGFIWDASLLWPLNKLPPTCFAGKLGLSIVYHVC